MRKNLFLLFLAVAVIAMVAIILANIQEIHCDWGLEDWSPDGEYLLVKEMCVGYSQISWTLILAASDGSRSERLRSGVNLADLSFCSDGENVVLRHMTGGYEGLVAIWNLGTGEIRDLTHGGYRTPIVCLDDGVVVMMVQDPGLPFIQWWRYQIDFEGRITRLYVPSQVSQEEISPDGQQVAGVRNTSGNWDIYVMDVGGRDELQLTYTAENDYMPVWSPDGTRIAFLRETW